MFFKHSGMCASCLTYFKSQSLAYNNILAIYRLIFLIIIIIIIIIIITIIIIIIIIIIIGISSI